MFGVKMEVKDIDRGFKRLKKDIKKQNKAEILIGIFGGTSNPLRKTEAFTIPQYAAVQEFGTRDGKIPARSFMRSTFDDNLRKYIRLIAKKEKMVVSGKISLRRMFNEIGIVISSDIKKKITRGPFEPLSQATLKIRKSRVKSGLISSKPLIDTGTMRNAVLFELKIGGRSKRSSASS